MASKAKGKDKEPAKPAPKAAAKEPVKKEAPKEKEPITTSESKENGAPVVSLKPKTQPDPAVLRTKIAELQAQIQQYQKETETLSRSARDARTAALSGERSRIEQVRAEIAEADTQIREFEDKKRALKARLNDCNDIKRFMEQEKRDRQKECKFDNVQDIINEIKKLEFSLETGGGGNIKREKTIMAQISRLEISKNLVREQEDFDDTIEEKREEAKSILAELEDRVKGIDSSYEKKKKALEEMKELQGKVQAQLGKTNDVQKERDDLRVKIQKCYDDIRQLKTDFETQKEEYREYIVARRVLEQEQRERRQKEFEERKAFKENARKAREKEINQVKRLNPHETEIGICDTLIFYLDGLDKRNKQQQANSERQAKAASETPSQLKNGMVALKRKDNDTDSWMFTDRTKQNKPKEKPVAAKVETAPKQDVRLRHPVEKFASFEQVGVPIPLNASDIAKTVVQLTEKRDHFKTFIRSQEELDAEDSAAELKAKLLKEKKDKEDAAEAAKPKEVAKEETPVASAPNGTESENPAQKESETVNDEPAAADAPPADDE